MENLLTSIANVSAFLFASFILFILLLRFIIGFVKWRVRSTAERLIIIDKELEELSSEIAEIEGEFHNLGGGSCDPCTKDDPAIGCRTASLNSRIKEINNKKKKFIKDHAFFIKTTRIITKFILSPLGSVISFIVHTDSSNERSKS